MQTGPKGSAFSYFPVYHHSHRTIPGRTGGQERNSLPDHFGNWPLFCAASLAPGHKDGMCAMVESRPSKYMSAAFCLFLCNAVFLSDCPWISVYKRVFVP